MSVVKSEVDGSIHVQILYSFCVCMFGKLTDSELTANNTNDFTKNTSNENKYFYQKNINDISLTIPLKNH